MIVTSDLRKLGIFKKSRVLIVMPHPDDEAIFTAGIIHKLTSEHIPVRLITMTVGEKSTLRFGLTPKDNLKTIRQKEMRRALSILGVTDFHMYEYPDGNLASHKEKITATVRRNISEWKPTHIITLEPDGIYGHPDHVTLSRCVSLLTKKPIRLIFATVPAGYYMTRASRRMAQYPVHPIPPTITLKLTAANAICKIKALAAHRSQFAGPPARVAKTAILFCINRLIRREYFHTV